jgi:hypothetical protein
MMKSYWWASLSFLLGMWALLALPGTVFDAVIAEDSWVENLGAVGLFLTGGFFAACFVRVIRQSSGRESRLRTLSFLGLALLFFLGGGEEISWGQRLFGWATPEMLQQTNVQHETNLHNLAWMHGWLDMGRLFQIFTLVFTIVVPAIAARSSAARHFFERFMPVLPWQLGVPFAANFVLSKVAGVALGSLYTGTTPLVQGVTELKETNYSVLFWGVAMLVYRNLARETKAMRSPMSSVVPS